MPWDDTEHLEETKDEQKKDGNKIWDKKEHVKSLGSTKITMATFK